MIMKFFSISLSLYNLNFFKESISYEFGPNRGIIIFSFPDEKRPETSEDQIAFGFMTTRSNAILLLISSDYSKDYLQIELVSFFNSFFKLFRKILIFIFEG